jgi:uncharacterized UBP type Zn finger protein
MTERQRIESNAWKVKQNIEDGFTVEDCKNALTIKHNAEEANKTIYRYFEISGYLQ